MPDMLKQISFAKLEHGMEMPHLLDIQTRAFEALLQLDAASHDREDVGLERVFKDLFPITDVHENYSLEFVRYSLGEPKYSVEECIERDMTYSVPLKATLQLVVMEEVGETVKINDGPFLNFSGVIEEIEPERGKLKVTVNIFGRNTPVELEYWQVEKA